MTHSRIARELPFASASLLSDHEYVARYVLRSKLKPDTYDECKSIIHTRMERVMHQSDQLHRAYESAIHLCQIDYRRNVELARKHEPNKEDRADLIKLHTEAYKVACMYATRRYKESVKMVMRICEMLNDFLNSAPVTADAS